MSVAQFDVIVIGAGFAGAAFARSMADSGRNVLVIEKRPYAGGNMYDENVSGIFVHQYGPHIFHTNNRKVFAFLKRFSKWYNYEHHVAGKIDGKYVPIPFNFTSIDTLFDEQAARNIKEKLKAAFGDGSRISVFDLLNSPDADIKEFGQFVFEKVFVNYTAKQWGIPAGEVDTSTINRVPVVIGYDTRYFTDAIQAMPKDGFTRVFEKMLDAKNIAVQLNTNAKGKLRFDFENKKIYFDGAEYTGIVFFTGAVDDFFDFRYGKLPYRSLNLVFETVSREWYQSAAVVNYPNDER
ncbi:MAG: hypothetical protein Pg6C_12650 [Treponemataceae bacterium]|nr:MAG: hypothetical protein Pg6C_12650 [Treponemataceae bacterium]